MHFTENGGRSQGTERALRFPIRLAEPTSFQLIVFYDTLKSLKLSLTCNPLVHLEPVARPVGEVVDPPQSHFRRPGWVQEYANLGLNAMERQIDWVLLPCRQGAL